ncbi:hypothetical protein K9N68_23810 [Kovacikia minuta CCNUW1]|uniref:hypothetical protein n=1 Tax=Kovacikia minuta TaxID=2931930 RepID=UPI001CCC2002|nr:hypothetical protein [Kovacikia minuta]UBF24674.1 hypothetical protein K9N68_23810 [Kovacikia minuta CCNUW1]
MAVGKSILRMIWVIGLAIVLVGCSAMNGPSSQVVERAIALQLSQTQQELSQQLRLGSQPTDLVVKRVNITEQTPLKIQDLPSFRVMGTYDYTVKLPSQRVTQRQNPFEVYLQRQKEGKTWRVARLQTNEAGEPIWVTQLVD